MTPRDSVAQRLRTARVACLVTVGSLSGFALRPDIAEPARDYVAGGSVAGGLILLLVSLDMLRAQRSTVRNPGRKGRRDEQRRHRHYPLAIPHAGGTGCDFHRDPAGNTGDDLDAAGGIGMPCTDQIGELRYISDRRAQLKEWLNPIAEKIISRLMGLLLAALAVQFMVNALTGDRGLLRGLAGH